MSDCISLSGSTACPAFTSASISTDSTLVGLFSFLQYVSDTSSFDSELKSYVSSDYVQTKYETLLGCSGIDLSNTTELYARYTTTVICNSIIQNSKTACNVSDADAPPVCADTCAEFASSESYLVADSAVCTSPSDDAATQIRADFTNCALPADSLTQSCVEGSTNEPDNCGYGNSTIGLCSYCGSGGVNSTDTCCYNSNAESRCAGVVLPTITSSMVFTTATSSATSSPTSSSDPSSGGGLSGGAIAGIVIGSIAGLALLAALAFFLLACIRKRRNNDQHGSVFNQPSPARKGDDGMAYKPVTQKGPEGYEVLPGGRIARMSALEGNSGSPPRGQPLTAAAVGAAAGYGAGRRSNRNDSSSDVYSATSEVRGGVLRPPPMSLRRSGSLSSGSVLNDLNSPISGSGGGLSSPQVGSQQSEQLASFKDYYSHEEIHSGDRVSVLWAYQPRAADEFTLERGDMLKVIGIWDDGWATGKLLNQRADEWDEKYDPQRDSGVSNGSERGASAAGSGEIKAFPLVCVCLPQHWRRTLEGDGSTETGSLGGKGTMTS